MSGAATMVAVHELESFDGTRLAYYTAGKRDGPVMVLCNGCGGNMVVWRELIRRFAPRFRLISWDYRGLFGSSAAADPRAYSVPVHTRDLLHLLEHEGVQAPVLVGWSMGVQVSLELHRSHPKFARAMVALHGAHGHPLRTAFDSSIAESLSPLAFAGMRLLGRGLESFGPTLARTASVVDGLAWTGKQLGLMAPELDSKALGELAEEWIQMDLGVYAEIFRQMNEHTAEDLLASIQTPTLVIAGGRDRFTPAHLSADLAEKLPDAVLHIVDEATHFGLLEVPEVIVECIEEYLEERLGIALG